MVDSEYYRKYPEALNPPEKIQPKEERPYYDFASRDETTRRSIGSGSSGCSCDKDACLGCAFFAVGILCIILSQFSDEPGFYEYVGFSAGAIILSLIISRMKKYKNKRGTVFCILASAAVCASLSRIMYLCEEFCFVSEPIFAIVMMIAALSYFGLFLTNIKFLIDKIRVEKDLNEALYDNANV